MFAELGKLNEDFRGKTDLFVVIVAITWISIHCFLNFYF